MSSEDQFKLLCIPQDGIPFEAIGSHRARRCSTTQPDLVIGDMVRREFGDDIIPSRPLSINPILSTYNKVWGGVEKIIEDMWSGDHPTKRISVFVSKNDKLHGYNKYVTGDYRPKGNIYIWISSEDYSMYDHHLEQKYKKQVLPNIHAWVSYEETNFTFVPPNKSTITEQCRCYTCLEPNLSWTMSNL
jgi:hypothetical protein